MVERCPCKADVSGSSPLISTSLRTHTKKSRLVAHAHDKKKLTALFTLLMERLLSFGKSRMNLNQNSIILVDMVK